MLADIVARWPGSTHDSHIFRASAVGGNLEGTGLKDGALHGNGGHTCSPFLMNMYLHFTQSRCQLKGTRAREL